MPNLEQIAEAIRTDRLLQEAGKLPPEPFEDDFYWSREDAGEDDSVEIFFGEHAKQSALQGKKVTLIPFVSHSLDHNGRNMREDGMRRPGPPPRVRVGR